MNNAAIQLPDTGQDVRPRVIESTILPHPKTGDQDPSPEPRSIDEIIDNALAQCDKLPASFISYKQQIHELHSRLAYGRLHLAVVGEFNRGKSTFINSLIGIGLLPTSVLPITSVPTSIIYGKDLSCTIRFLYDKPAIVVTASQEAVTDTLFKYVAEESNPKNLYGVSSVEVTVPSPLLENGTVLIDTPGFGSTYLHNTQTALSALADCDAALFLLSVDPPMTQTEVEFLKMVINHVPRLFFIINKTDLLSGKDCAKVDKFVHEVLHTIMPSTVPPTVFKISALYATSAKSQSLTDSFWARSGMEAVKNDIVDFMAREKYFTLSQALNDKLKESIDGIVSSLKSDRSLLIAPISGIAAERDVIVGETASIKKILEKELSIAAAENKAIFAFFEETLSNGRLKLIRQIHDATDSLLNASSCSTESLTDISIALNKIIPEALYAFKVQLIAGLNKPLKRAALLHGKDYAQALESIRSCLAEPGTSQENLLFEKLETLEFESEEQPQITGFENNIKIALTLGDHFTSREQKIKRLRIRYSQQLDEMVKNDLLAFSDESKKRIASTFTALRNFINDEYLKLLQQLEKFIAHKEQTIASHKEKTDASVAELNRHIDAFTQIMTYLQ